MPENLKTDPKPQCVQTDVSKSVLLPQDLSHIFKNINHKPCTTIGYDFAWDISKNGKLIGELFYSNDDKEWWFIKDNFPHQRKSYRINFPIKEEVFFVELFKTIGIELIKQL